MSVRDKEGLIALIMAELGEKLSSHLAKHMAVEVVQENLIEDIGKLSRLTPSAFQVFHFIMANGPSNIFQIREGLREMAMRTVYYALNQLKDANLVNVDREHRWFITAKGFAPFCR